MGNIINLKEYKEKLNQQYLEKLDPNMLVNKEDIKQALIYIAEIIYNIKEEDVNKLYTRSDFNDLIDIAREIQEIIYKNDKE